MKYPKMILFDYGHTLLCEPGWDPVRGNEELLKYAVKNPNHCTIADVQKDAERIFGEHIGSIRKMGYEICGQVCNRVLYESLGIELSLTPLEMETVFWDAASIGAMMPETDKMLEYLRENGIRTAVISNLMWSGEALTKRLNRLLPENQFEFVMTSSDYLVRKPNPLLFEIALQKAGLCGEEVWYCGHNPKADIEGAAQVGIYPIWYDNDLEKGNRDGSHESPPVCEHVHIHQWSEMLDLLEKLKES